MNDIFVSYRRSDSSAIVGRIIDRLERRFGREHIFRDLDSIGYGQDFEEAINRALTTCEVLLVVIGNDWISVQNEAGERRLDNTEDWVRLEVSKALEQGIHIVPVLVENAAMPSASLLPDNLRPLANRNAANVRDDPDFNGDMERLCGAIRKHLSHPRFKFARWFSMPITLVAATVVLCLLVMLTASRLGLLGPSNGQEAGSQGGEEPARQEMLDVDALLAYLRKNIVNSVPEIRGTRVTWREETDQDLVEYLEIVATEADLVADVWYQVQKELVEAAVHDEKAWEQLVAKRRMLPPPNARYISRLKGFYEAVVEVSNQSNKQNKVLSRFIVKTLNLIDMRENAVEILDALISEDKDSGVENSSTRNTRLKELGKLLEVLSKEAADLKALALSVRKKLL